MVGAAGQTAPTKPLEPPLQILYDVVIGGLEPPPLPPTIFFWHMEGKLEWLPLWLDVEEGRSHDMDSERMSIGLAGKGQMAIGL